MERKFYIRFMTHERTTFEAQTGQTYLREFLPAVIGYAGVLAAIIVLVDFESAGAWKLAVALVPLIPAVWGCLAIVRHLQRVDELQRQIQLSGMATGFGVAMITAITFGFLAMAGLEAGRVGPWIIYAAGMLAWLVGNALASRRAL